MIKKESEQARRRKKRGAKREFLSVPSGSSRSDAESIRVIVSRGEVKGGVKSTGERLGKRRVN